MQKNNENNTETEVIKPTTEHLAMEVLKNEHVKSKSKDWIIGFLIIATAVISVGMAAIYYKNDVDWRKLFSDYDFISQDGEGINNANYGSQGDLNNGPEN